MKLHLTTRQIVFAALMIAATLVLEQLRIFHMPQGGSVTLGGMVPLILLAYLEGPIVGAIGGCLYGFLNMMQDPFILHPGQVLFDYPLPYMCMGIAGLLPAHRIASTALAFVARFACHFISGVVFFASYAPEGMNPAVYSMVFNATYLVPDFIICFVILKLLPIKRLPICKNKGVSPHTKSRTFLQSGILCRNARNCTKILLRFIIHREIESITGNRNKRETRMPSVSHAASIRSR